eukprot:CAMPEP_0194765258 /NCGR_PEP_ID=MMETSP0323_2-20130528/25670_1 /TAXON_ID=2866 ORGANISM="Crypthecodinium cohnii, Strain Seligo" /NCGR_SAMPLE_ID=MMETSP0323_2 /ASSEMBLY_ACC=CAM_ASM_000346 /LENGTH=180 /DNA_ID=CAMNT_0039694297 /DNA_START=69 /DNA_END=611 /DNA_ORIENTATION=+
MFRSVASRTSSAALSRGLTVKPLATATAFGRSSVQQRCPLLASSSSSSSSSSSRALAPQLWSAESVRRSSISVTFVKAADGSERTVPAEVGQSLLEVAFANKLDIEGACGGECACSTCHILLLEDDLEKFAEPDDDEADMLDLAPNVTDTSRLGCQLRLTKENNGMRITIPEGIVNLMAS